MYLDGVNLQVYAESARKAFQFMGIRERGQRGRLFVHESADPEDEEITTAPLAPGLARALALHVKGKGESFFVKASTSTTGSQGGVPNAGGSYTVLATSGPHTNCRVEVASGNFIELPFGSLLTGKWMIRVQRYETVADDSAAVSTWYRYIIQGTGTTVSAWWRNGVAEGSSPANWLTIATDGDLRLLGKDRDATNNAKWYSELQVTPYHPVSTWIVGLNAAMLARAPAGLPFLNLVDSDDSGFEPENVSTAIVVAGHISEQPRVKYGAQMQRVCRILLQHKTSAT